MHETSTHGTSGVLSNGNSIQHMRSASAVVSASASYSAISVKMHLFFPRASSSQVDKSSLRESARIPWPSIATGMG